MPKHAGVQVRIVLAISPAREQAKQEREREVEAGGHGVTGGGGHGIMASSAQSAVRTSG